MRLCVRLKCTYESTIFISLLYLVVPLSHNISPSATFNHLVTYLTIISLPLCSNISGSSFKIAVPSIYPQIISSLSPSLHIISSTPSIISSPSPVSFHYLPYLSFLPHTILYSESYHAPTLSEGLDGGGGGEIGSQ